jgi:CRP-like cAMP-binding protein
MGGSELQTFREIAFFKSLSEQAALNLSRECNRRTFEAGDLIIGHMDQTFDVLFLMSGHARVNVYSLAGRRVSFRDMVGGAIFGELSAIDGEPRSASVEAVGPCTVIVMPRKVFLRALREEPEFTMAVMVHLTRQVRTLTGRVFEFSTLAVRNRVQAELLRLARPEGQNEAVLSAAPTHEEIASRISSHREAVTRELSRLEEKGLIVKQGRSLRIPDLERLRRLIEEGGED